MTRPIDAHFLINLNATGRLREFADGLKGSVNIKGINSAARPRTPAMPLPYAIEL